jgi:hypothetical protein
LSFVDNANTIEDIIPKEINTTSKVLDSLLVLELKVKSIAYIKKIKLISKTVLAQAGYFELYRKNEVSKIGDVSNKYFGTLCMCFSSLLIY